jgi:hypothetical protein
MLVPGFEEYADAQGLYNLAGLRNQVVALPAPVFSQGAYRRSGGISA